MLEGLPAGLPLTVEDIDRDLARRQVGYGSGGRMTIESDSVRISSGVAAGESTGAPIALHVPNKDWSNWEGKTVTPITRPRPGHADLTGGMKYGYRDLRHALERASAVNARYHVLGGTLSPLDGVGPQDLTIDALVSRAHEPVVTEVILALNATVDGQTTAHYITDLLHNANVRVTRLAHGVPVGGELDYLDDGTLLAALRARRKV